MKRLALALVAMAAVGIGGAACGNSDKARSQPPPQTGDPSQLVGKPLPDASGENLAGGGTGKLSAGNGAPQAVAFWLNTCPDCQKEMPGFQLMASRLSDVRFASVAIDVEGDLGKGPPGYETPEAFVTTTKLTMPTIRLPQSTADATFYLKRLPTVLLVDSTGTVTKAFSWPFSLADIEAAARTLK